MPRPPHVVVIPADRSGCGNYRLIWPAQAVSLVRPDWAVEIRPPEVVQAGFLNNKFIGVRGLDPLPDLLVMQRVGTPGQLNVLRWVQEQGVATVVDYDDAMWCIDKDNTAFASWNRYNPHGQHWRTCDEAAQIASLVTVTTEALARHYGKKHHRTEVLPNCIPHAATEIPGHDENEVFTAGWAGFTSTHPGDCRISKPATEAVLESGGALRVIADAAGAAGEWDLPAALVDSILPQRLGPNYYKEISSLDLMLVGLKDTPFNRAKSFLKVLEAGAAGVPSIATDNPPHRALARTGFPVTLAASPSEWYDAAKRAKERWESEGRSHMQNEVWAAVQRDWTIEGNAERWAQAWERALQREQGR